MAEEAAKPVMTAQDVFSSAEKDGQDAYDAIAKYANDPDTDPDERAKAITMFGKNPWARADISGAKRLNDMSAGKKLANEFIADGTLGRMQEGRSTEVADLIAERRKAYEASPTGGLQDEELQAYRDQAVGNINKTSETARRRLSGIQANTGVRGATAATQQMSAINAGNQERTTFERDLFLKQREALQQDRAEQSTRFSALESSIESARSNEEATQKFNLEQVAKEKFGQISTALSFAGLGAMDRGAQGAISAQIQAAEAAKPPAKKGLF